VYWSEWHNDPPRCCDPCDCHGNWTGPSAGSYHHAPYAHAYAPHGYAGGGYAATTHRVMPGGSPANYAKANTFARSTAKQSSPQRHHVARPIQPASAKTRVVQNRGAAAIVIRR
jgi:hypothetical protein